MSAFLSWGAATLCVIWSVGPRYVYIYRTVDRVRPNLHVRRDVHEAVHVFFSDYQLAELGVLGIRFLERPPRQLGQRVVRSVSRQREAFRARSVRPSRRVSGLTA